MIEVTLYFDFPDELSNELHLSFEDVLRDLLNSTNEVRSFMPKLRGGLPAEVNSTELSLFKVLQNLKILNS